VSGVTDLEPQAVISAAAREHGCRLIQVGREFTYDYCGFQISDFGLHYPNSAISSVLRGPQFAIGTIDFSYTVPGQELELTAVPLAMLGRHQAANSAAALAAVAELRQQGWCVSTDAMREGIGRTVMPGRVELIPGEPLVVLDVAHNPASAQALVDALAELPAPARRTLILSISRDKDVRAIVAKLVPHFDRIIATQYQDNPRAAAADELAALVRAEVSGFLGSSSVGLPASSTSGIASGGKSSYSPPEIFSRAVPAEAWKFARRSALPAELICIAGSLFLAAELRPLVRAGD
jgi:dihydrofolate synthase/folylpolyglutamate synthase